MAERKPGFDTLALHAGTTPDPATGAREFVGEVLMDAPPA